MYQVKIDDMILTVDEETAEQLKDPEYANMYISAVKREILKEVPENPKNRMQNKSNLWTSPKNPTEEDHQATLALIALRHSCDDEFKDKKTHKNKIWEKIAQKLNEIGFFVGEGVEAREKVRQKFSNLQSTYIKYCDSQKMTGEGKLKIPKYFNELDEILGDKHKVNPILVIDSTTPAENENSNGKNEIHCGSSWEGASTSSCKGASTSSCKGASTSSGKGSTTSSSTSNYTNSEGEISSHNRFNTIKRTVRPKPDKLETLKELVVIQKQNQDIRSKDFTTMMNFFQEQNEQRNKQILSLIEKMGEKKKKRKRSSSSDE